MDQNLWIGIGRLAKEPEFVPAGRKGTAHISFTLVVNRVVARESGPKADYMPCTYWGEDAAALVEQLHKGNEIYVSGRIYTEMVQRNAGKRDFFWEIRVDEIQLGRAALKNLGAPLKTTHQTAALDRLHGEFEE